MPLSLTEKITSIVLIKVYFSIFDSLQQNCLLYNKHIVAYFSSSFCSILQLLAFASLIRKLFRTADFTSVFPLLLPPFPCTGLPNLLPPFHKWKQIRENYFVSKPFPADKCK